MHSTLMINSHFRQVVEKCRARSFQALALASSLEAVSLSANCRLELFDELIKSVNESTPKQAVKRFCDEWELLNNNESIIWIIKAAIDIPDQPFAEFVLKATLDVLTSPNILQNDRDSMFDLIRQHCSNDATFMALVLGAFQSSIDDPRTLPDAHLILLNYLILLEEMEAAGFGRQHSVENEEIEDAESRLPTFAFEDVPNTQQLEPLYEVPFSAQPIAPLPSQTNSDDEQSHSTPVALAQHESFDTLVGQVEEIPGVLTFYFRPCDLLFSESTSEVSEPQSSLPKYTDLSYRWLSSKELCRHKSKVVIAVFSLGFQTFLIVCQDGMVITCNEKTEAPEDDLKQPVPSAATKISHSKRYLKLSKLNGIRRSLSLFSFGTANNNMDPPIFYSAAVDKVQLFVSCAKTGVFTCSLDQILNGRSSTIILMPFLSSETFYNGISLTVTGYPPSSWLFCCSRLGSVDCISNKSGDIVTQLTLHDFYPEICVTYSEPGVPTDNLLIAVSGYSRFGREIKVYLMSLDIDEWKLLCSLELYLRSPATPEKYPHPVAFDQIGNFYAAVKTEGDTEALLAYSWARIPNGRFSRTARHSNACNPLVLANKGEDCGNWLLVESWRVAVKDLVTSLTVTSGIQGKVIFATISSKGKHKGQDILCYKLSDK